MFQNAQTEVFKIMPIVVMKFGGSCLLDKTAFDKILRIINIYKDVKKIFVASAFNAKSILTLPSSLSISRDSAGR